MCIVLRIKIRLKTKVDSIRMKISTQTKVYSIRIQIRAKIKVYSTVNDLINAGGVY